MVVPRGHGVAPREAVLGLGAALGEAESHGVGAPALLVGRRWRWEGAVPWGGMRGHNLRAYPNF